MKKIINPWVGLVDEGYNCFGCAPNNPYGLKMEFYEDGDEIVSFWSPGDNYQGWLKTLHGGIQAALADEISAWVIARKLQTSGMTTSLNMKYRKPIPTGDDIRLEVRAHIREMKRNLAIIEVALLYENEICSQAELTFYCFPKETAAKDFFFSGCDIEE